MPINPDKIAVMSQGYYTPRFDIYDRDLEGPVVQMGITLKHFTGDIYIKVEHLEFIAREHLGMVSQADYDAIKFDRDKTDARNEELVAQLDARDEKEQEKFDARIDAMFTNHIMSRLPDDVSSPVAGDSAGTKTVEPESATGKSKAETKNSGIDL